MKKVPTKCEPALVSRFSDGELGPEEHALLSSHLRDCASCQKTHRENQALSALFKASLEGELSQVNLHAFEQGVMDKIQAGNSPWWMGFRDLLAPKKILIPAAAMAAMLVLFFSLMRPLAPVTAPSAIINSFTGEVSSVMIIETPKSRQTIIWFNEA
ncbi:MAG: zf-HC2 domain-containing protein [Deltaproteobacteria bacterium]|nr:zf-HC2 domain-containing protein [Deltaproteobacteria bacterium]